MADLERVIIECPSCGKTGAVPADRIGRRVRCPGCGEAVYVEDPEVAAGVEVDEEEPPETPVRRKKRRKRSREPESALAPGTLASFVLGFAGAAIGAAIGGMIWHAVAVQYLREVRIVAWAVGLLAGAGMFAGVRRRGALGGIIAASTAVVTIFITKYAIYQSFYGPNGLAIAREQEQLAEATPEESAPEPTEKEEPKEEVEAKEAKAEADAKTSAESKDAKDASAKAAEKKAKAKKKLTPREEKEFNKQKMEVTRHLTEVLQYSKPKDERPTMLAAMQEANKRVAAMTPEEVEAEYWKQHVVGEIAQDILLNRTQILHASEGDQLPERTVARIMAMAEVEKLAPEEIRDRSLRARAADAYMYVMLVERNTTLDAVANSGEALLEFLKQVKERIAKMPIEEVKLEIDKDTVREMIIIERGLADRADTGTPEQRAKFWKDLVEYVNKMPPEKIRDEAEKYRNRADPVQEFVEAMEKVQKRSGPAAKVVVQRQDQRTARAVVVVRFQDMFHMWDVGAILLAAATAFGITGGRLDD